MELFLITLVLMVAFFLLLGVKTLLIDKPLQKSCGNAPLLASGAKLADCDCNSPNSDSAVHYHEEEHLCIVCPNKDDCSKSEFNESDECQR